MQIRVFRNKYNSYWSLLAVYRTEKDHLLFALLFIIGLFIANFSFSVWYLIAKFLNHIDITKTGIQGYITFLWGITSNIFIFPAGAFVDYKSYCLLSENNRKYSPQQWLDNFSLWLVGAILFSFSSGIAAYIFYNSGIDPLLWSDNFQYKFKELFSTFCWAFIMVTLILLPFFLCPKKWNRIFYATYLYYTYLWIFFTISSVLLFYFVFFPTDEKFRGILAGIGLRSGIFLGLYFSVLKQNIEKENNMIIQSKGDKIMDITPFVPVIVEATKFFFNEISKLIVVMRKKSSTAHDLPISKDELERAESDPGSILSFINDSITSNDINEIKTLVKLIKLNQGVMRELETQEAVASGEELAKIRMLLKEKYEIVIDKSVRLNDLLKQVYRVK